MMCFAEEHSSHKCSDIKKLAEGLTKQLDGDINALQKTDDGCNKLMKRLEGDKKKLTDITEKARLAINAEAVKLHSIVERLKQEMLAKLSEVENNNCYKEIESKTEDAELRSVLIRNFIQYETQLKQNGTACDIAKLASSMQERATELLPFNLDLSYSVNVKFTGNSSYDKAKRMFGKLHVEGL